MELSVHFFLKKVILILQYPRVYFNFFLAAQRVTGAFHFDPVYKDPGSYMFAGGDSPGKHKVAWLV